MSLKEKGFSTNLGPLNIKTDEELKMFLSRVRGNDNYTIFPACRAKMMTPSNPNEIFGGEADVVVLTDAKKCRLIKLKKLL